ncbi:hypothetical protein LTR53_013293 [Teratosphaeriaceae sp. CCFEE 6253]|nr:hypothetical protein LTR53_013293 [Teratosphaeriaceae sp. CCFEE 6253]
MLRCFWALLALLHAHYPTRALGAFLIAPRYSNYTSIAIYSSEETGLASALACNAAKRSWLSSRETATTVPSVLSLTTFTTSHAAVSMEINRYTTTRTFLTNSTAYTLCDGYTRLDGSTTTSTWLKTTFHTSLDHFLTTHTFATAPRATADPPPSCIIASSNCSVLASRWSSSHSQWAFAYSSYTSANTAVGYTGTPPPSVAWHSPLCAKLSAPKTGAAVADDAVCFVPQASVELLYWPVSTASSRHCNGSVSTMTMGPTIAGRPNTFRTLNSTLTSPTVYILVNGRWGYTSAGTTFANQTSMLLPLSSTAVSSYCGNYNSTYVSPTPVNYANFVHPVPARAYRCQPKCFSASASTFLTTDTASIGEYNGSSLVSLWYTTLQTYATASTYPLKNLCSTIWDDYAPALSVPAALLSMHPVTMLGGTGFCSFSVGEANVFFDPPRALTQATGAAGPSTSVAVPAATTALAPTVSADPAGSVVAPVAGSTAAPGLASSPAVVGPGSRSQTPPSIGGSSSATRGSVASGIGSPSSMAADPAFASADGGASASKISRNTASVDMQTSDVGATAVMQGPDASATDVISGVPVPAESSPASASGAGVSPISSGGLAIIVVPGAGSTEVPNSLMVPNSAHTLPEHAGPSPASSSADVAGVIASILGMATASSTPIAVARTSAAEDPGTPQQTSGDVLADLPVVSLAPPAPSSAASSTASTISTPTTAEASPSYDVPALSSPSTNPPAALVWTVSGGAKSNTPAMVSGTSVPGSAASPTELASSVSSLAAGIASVLLPDPTLASPAFVTDTPTHSAPAGSPSSGAPASIPASSGGGATVIASDPAESAALKPAVDSATGAPAPATRTDPAASSPTRASGSTSTLPLDVDGSRTGWEGDGDPAPTASRSDAGQAWSRSLGVLVWVLLLTGYRHGLRQRRRRYEAAVRWTRTHDSPCPAMASTPQIGSTHETFCTEWMAPASTCTLYSLAEVQVPDGRRQNSPRTTQRQDIRRTINHGS